MNIRQSLITVRLAKLEDSRAMSVVFAKAWQNAYQAILPKDFLNNLSETHWVVSFDNMFVQNKIQAYVALIDHKIVGAIIIDAQEGRIIALNVLPNYQHLGVGRQLMRQVFKLLQISHRTIYLQVLRKNYSARAFYEKMGFENTRDMKILVIANTEFEEYIYKYKFEEVE